MCRKWETQIVDSKLRFEMTKILLMKCMNCPLFHPFLAIRSRDEDPEEDTAKKARTATTTAASEQDQAGESPVYTPVQEPAAQDEVCTYIQLSGPVF